MLLIPKIDDQSSEPLFLQIYNYLKAEIRSGRIPVQAKLPSIRQLAEQLNISRNPVEAAYQELIAEGYVQSAARSGVRVLDWRDGVDLTLPSLAESQLHTDPKQEPAIIDFGFDHMAAESFPYSTWRKLTLSLLQPSHKELYYYGDPLGEYGLREEISKWLCNTRGILCSPDQVMITSGTQHSLLLISFLINKRDSLLAVEEAIHNGVKLIFEQQGFELLPIELDKDGISIEALSRTQAKTVYVTPSRQFPYGMTMPLSRRRALLKWCRQNDGLIIEDDYDNEFRFSGKPVHSLFGMHHNESVVYIGTFSKALAPALRMGYLVIPPVLRNQIEELRNYDQSVSRLQQKTMHLFMKEGYWEKHVRRMKFHYRKKQELLLTVINNVMGDKVSVHGTFSGLHIVLKIKESIPESVLVKKAESVGVKVYAASAYRLLNKPACPEIILGFGGLLPEEIIEGIRLLNNAWFSP